MPKLIGMLKQLKPDDTIDGSSQMARAVWALGRLGKPSSPAEIARTIRGRASLNWEDPQAARFFHIAFDSPIGITSYRSWFIRIDHNHRYLYDLTDEARKYFRKAWVDGSWPCPAQPLDGDETSWLMKAFPKVGRMTWKQERPEWCPHPHKDCIFRRRVMDSLCGGALPEPTPHDGDENTHRLCIRAPESDPPTWDMMVNASDLDWLRWVLDALDGDETSWLSKRKAETDG